MAKQTASNTIGPFFHHIVTAEDHDLDGIAGSRMAGKKTKGEKIKVEGRILDSEGKPLRAAMLEIWQANAAGRYNSPMDARDDVKLDKSSPIGRVSSGNKGKFEFETIKPGLFQVRVMLSGAAYQSDAFCGGHPFASLHATLFLGRDGSERYRSGALIRWRGSPRHADRQAEKDQERHRLSFRCQIGWGRRDGLFRRLSARDQIP